MGYRLGNLTAKHFADEKQQRGIEPQKYGILNYKNGEIDNPHHYLEIRASNQEHRSLSELILLFQASLKDEEIKKRFQLERNSVANVFTYFDCTDYKDVDPDQPDSTDIEKPIVSRALRKSVLNIYDYFQLSLDYFVRRTINTHGGYFQGQLSQQIMYELAFQGFKHLLLLCLERPLRGRTPEQFDELSAQEQKESLEKLSKVCQSKGIQVILAPVRTT